MGSCCDIIGVRSFAGLKDKAEDYEERVINQFIKYSGRPCSAWRPPPAIRSKALPISSPSRSTRPRLVRKCHDMGSTPRGASQAVPNSFVQWMVAAGYEVVVTHPEGYELDSAFLRRCDHRLRPAPCACGCRFVYAKNWSAYVDPHYGEVLCKSRDWTVDAEDGSHQYAYFMHCLPVRRGMIVTDDVIEVRGRSSFPRLPTVRSRLRQ